jgi:hypothetical protein
VALTAVFPWWLALLAVLMLAAVLVWANRRETVYEATAARASQAEARAATAEAVVTAQVEMQTATAAALAYASSPEAAVQRSLKSLFAAEQDPTDDRLQTINETFGPAALVMVRPEVEHLLSGGLHLGGRSAYDVAIVGTTITSPTQAQVVTRERWTYDERTADDQPARCLVEMSEQTYVLQRAGPDWQVADIELATSARSDCPR